MRALAIALRRLLLIVAVVLTTALATPPARGAETGNDLLDLSIEDLLRVEIDSASRKSQLLSQTAAAAFVITQDDIRRSSARNVPELLRMVPGIEVAQIDANKWAVTARGFNGRFANKLLVLMDGRALFTPSFAGVFWDVQDTLLADIERIEIIRGPGGTLWGANAVNGVINIITRSSNETQGGELIASGDSNRSTSASLRYGDHVGADFSFRVYAKYLDQSGNENLAGHGTADDWHLGRIGARADWTLSPGSQLSMTTETYRGKSGASLMRPSLNPPYASFIQSDEDLSGFFTIAQWRRRLGEMHEFEAQTYFERTDHEGMLFGEKRDTARAELQYRFPLGDRQDVIAGAGYRHDAYTFEQTADVNVSPSHPSVSGYNAFVQGESQLIQNRLSLTVGIDLEHNPLSASHLDALPSGRLLLTLDERNRLWAAVTKAVSTPSYENTAASVQNAAPIGAPGSAANPFPVPLVTTVVANPNVGSETLIAYELGYRVQLGSDVTLDSTVYFHDYRDVRSQATSAVYCAPSNTPVFENPLCVMDATSVVEQLQFQNALHGNATGLELAADWVPYSALRLRAAYTRERLNLKPASNDAALVAEAANTEGMSPRSQLFIRADFGLSRSMDVDLAIRHVDRLPAIPVPQYWSADANVIWRVSPHLELSLSGTNLLQRAHLEFVSELADVVPTKIERVVAARARWTF